MGDRMATQPSSAKFSGDKPMSEFYTMALSEFRRVLRPRGRAQSAASAAHVVVLAADRQFVVPHLRTNTVADVGGCLTPNFGICWAQSEEARLPHEGSDAALF